MAMSCEHCGAGPGNLERTTEYSIDLGRDDVVRCLKCGKRHYGPMKNAMTRQVEISPVKKIGHARVLEKLPCTLAGCTRFYSDNGLVKRQLCRTHSRLMSTWESNYRRGRDTPPPLLQTNNGWVWNPEVERKRA